MATSAQDEPGTGETADTRDADLTAGDLKAKFKAALDRKHGHESAGPAQLTGGSASLHTSDKRQRQFRRKSG